MFLEYFRDQFEPRVRERGERYAAGGRVELAHVGRRGVAAHVRGTNVYRVGIVRGRCPDASPGSKLVVVGCECAYGVADLCKHVWATLREVARVYPDWGPEISAQGAHIERASMLLPSELAVCGIDTDRGIPFAHDDPPLPVRGEAWYERVSRIEDARAAGAAGAMRQRLYYALVAGDDARDGALVIDVYQQRERKTGGWGALRAVRTAELASVEVEPAERDLLRLLQRSYGGERALFEAAVVRVEVPPLLARAALPALCSTGRFGVLHDRELAPIAWDGGAPWRFELQVEPTAEGALEVRGALNSDGAVRRIDEALVAADLGIAVFEDCALELELGPAARPWLRELARAPLVVPAADADALATSLAELGVANQLAIAPELGWKRERGTPRAVLRLSFADASAASVPAELAFGYGARVLGAREGGSWDAEAGQFSVRDPDAERALEAELEAAGAVPGAAVGGRWHIERARVAEVVAALLARNWRVELDGARVRRAERPRARVASGIDWFDLRLSIGFGDDSLELPALLAAARRGDDFVELADGSRGLIPEPWRRRLAALAGAPLEGDALRLSRVQASLLDALLASFAAEAELELDRKFQSARSQLAALHAAPPAEPPAGFGAELRDYQRAGLGWLQALAELGLGGCLADDMGLGKTVQVLALLDGRRRRRLPEGTPRAPSIAVVPKSLVWNWQAEARRFAPELRTEVYAGAGRRAQLERLDEVDLLITTYGTLRRDAPVLTEHCFDYALLDEAQAIKNRTSQTAKACRLLRAEHRLALTGTPIENRLDDLLSIFGFLAPGLLDPAEPMLRQLSREDEGLAVTLVSRALAPFILRRTKDQVLDELPAKHEQLLYCELGVSQRRNYDELRMHFRQRLLAPAAAEPAGRSKIHVLEALLRLRQAACHPGLIDRARADEASAKLELLLEQLDEVVSGGHKALVFSQFTSFLAIVRDRLDRLELDYEYLDGRTRDRAARVTRFQDDPACRVFLISLKAGGHGLNLTAADYVFLLDPWWNPAVESQAIDRSHRIGQTRRVNAYRLIARNTVEDKVLALQAKKRKFADAIITRNASVMAELTTDELDTLLG